MSIALRSREDTTKEMTGLTLLAMASLVFRLYWITFVLDHAIPPVNQMNATPDLTRQQGFGARDKHMGYTKVQHSSR